MQLWLLQQFLFRTNGFMCTSRNPYPLPPVNVQSLDVPTGMVAIEPKAVHELGCCTRFTAYPAYATTDTRGGFNQSFSQRLKKKFQGETSPEYFYISVSDFTDLMSPGRPIPTAISKVHARTWGQLSDSWCKTRNALCDKNKGKDRISDLNDLASSEQCWKYCKVASSGRDFRTLE